MINAPSESVVPIARAISSMTGVVELHSPKEVSSALVEGRVFFGSRVGLDVDLDQMRDVVGSSGVSEFAEPHATRPNCLPQSPRQLMPSTRHP